uniref:uncharacterized protein LOC104265334 isoform X3 n=1 Tax=Ciona intestinalis TaxID=7719 RepID=UPI00089DBCA9|nr:uncharacterized protein LOC104265334 isoform X3 [Ciona intestinalis]|eukprot:XP_009857794.2 uncharacterized protein LOC104265334 isoform X3 [Ciona intestinalis]
MYKIVVSIDKLPTELRTIKATTVWRGDLCDINTEFVRDIPPPLRPTNVRRGGISAIICFAILRSYPEASVSNFRQLTDSQLIFTVENEGQLIDDIKSEVGNRKLNSSLQDLPSLLSDSLYSVFKTSTLTFELELTRSSTVQIDSKTTVPDNRNRENNENDLSHEMSTNPKVKESSTNLQCTETTVDSSKFRFEDMLSFLTEDDGASLFNEGKYREAIPFLESSLKTVPDQEQPLLQLKLALCLRACNREYNSFLTKALTSVEKQDTSLNNIMGYAEEFIHIAKKYEKEKSFVPAVLIYYASATIYSKTMHVTTVFPKLSNCMTDILSVAQENSTQSCVKLVLSKLTQIINLLKSMKECEEQAEAIGTGYMYLGGLYNAHGMLNKAISSFQSGIEVLEKASGKNAAKNSDYGMTTYHLARSMRKVGENPLQVERILMTAIERQKGAEDWKLHSKTKQQQLKESEDELKKLRCSPAYRSCLVEEKKSKYEQEKTSNQQGGAQRLNKPDEHTDDEKVGLKDENQFHFEQVLEQQRAEDKFDQGCFDEALPHLEEALKNAPPEEAIYLKLKIALCQKKLGKNEESKRLVTSVMKNLTENPPNEYKCFATAELIRKIAEKYVEYSYFSMAVWMYVTAAKLFSLSSDHSNALIGIYNSMKNLDHINDIKGTSTYVDTFLHTALTEVLNMMVAFSTTHNIQHKAKYLGKAYHLFGVFCYTNKNMQDAISLYQKGIKIYEEEFGSDAKYYFLYGVCTHNLAVSIETNGQINEAREMFVIAMDRQMAATDWESEDKRKRSINLTRVGLERTSVYSTHK